MALFGRTNKTEGGFMDVIRCDQPDYLVWKWRPNAAEYNDETSKAEGHTREGINATIKENAIRYGSSLRVKDGEVAVFVYQQKDGTFQDFIEGPFDSTIKTANFPVLARIVGAAFGGASPFQAEVYFINLAGINQITFGVPFFDVYDPRFLDFGVPIAVRGKMTFKLADYRAFIKLHRLINFNTEDFKAQIKSAIVKYVKAVVSNAPSDHGIPVVQLERKILDISGIVENHIKDRMSGEFGVIVSSVDIDTIEAAKDSEGYQKLMSVTQDIAAATTVAQADVNIKNMQDMQAINAANMEETMRIQREELQHSQRMQTDAANFAVHQLNQQTQVAMAGADAMGRMGEGGAMSMGANGGGMNPGGMMARMMMGGTVGGQMAGMMGNMMHGMQQSAPPAPGTTPPPPPLVQYNVAVNGQTLGPFDLNMLAQMAQSGQLTQQSQVWKQGMSAWAAAGTVQELAGLFAPAGTTGAPPPPPPPIS